MHVSVDCPWSERGRLLLDAFLSPEEREHYERHLESCPTCQDHIDRPEEGDKELLTLVRQVGDPTLLDVDPMLCQALEQLHDEKPPSGTSPAELSDLSFLGPSNPPGVLGTLGDYEVREVIGQGGMGIVLKAFDLSLHRLVAIKVLASAVAGNRIARQRFVREARAAASVCHEHLVPIHGVHEVQGRPWEWSSTPSP
jgi:hypothetical protein